jgi:hypothetical protein
MKQPLSFSTVECPGQQDNHHNYQHGIPFLHTNKLEILQIVAPLFYASGVSVHCRLVVGGLLQAVGRRGLNVLGVVVSLGAGAMILTCSLPWVKVTPMRSACGHFSASTHVNTCVPPNPCPIVIISIIIFTL